MEPSEAVATLRAFNSWRRCDEDSFRPDPRAISQAIDELCDYAERMDRELQERAESWRMSSVCRAKEAEIERLKSEIEHHKHDAKAWSAVAKGYLGERDDARAELERRANARAIQAMTPQERFALMFQQTPTDDKAGG